MLPSPTFAMLVGLPYSGKSTYAEHLDESGCIAIHSSDAIREELFGCTYNREQNAAVFEVLNRRIMDDLNAGKSVIYDATNLNYKRRMDMLRELSGVDCAKMCFLMATPYEEILLRRKRRDRVVQYDDMERMYQSIWIPNIYEGWDTISIVYPEEFACRDVGDLLSVLKWVPHNSLILHSSIGMHCLGTRDRVRRMVGCTRELEYAALLHDVGRPRMHDDDNGKPVVESYNERYQNISAYDSLFYVPRDFDRLHVASVIQWHTKPIEIYRLPGSQQADAFDAFRKLVGERVYWDVIALHQADMQAQ